MRKFILILKFLVSGLIAIELTILISGAIGNYSLEFRHPHTSAFIRHFELKHKNKATLKWQNLENISPHLIKAIIVAEDDSFFKHQGIDWKQIKKSWKKNWKKKKLARGGSTLTMQLVKNLYFSKEKSFVRKFNEILLAYHLETTTSKKRILEVYLNIVEWGNGIYGAEAASQYYFSKPANRLSPYDAAYLAALLPNPKYLSIQGKQKAQRRKRIILRRMERRRLPEFKNGGESH